MSSEVSGADHFRRARISFDVVDHRDRSRIPPSCVQAFACATCANCHGFRMQSGACFVHWHQINRRRTARSGFWRLVHSRPVGTLGPVGRTRSPGGPRPVGTSHFHSVGGVWANRTSIPSGSWQCVAQNPQNPMAHGQQPQCPESQGPEPHDFGPEPTAPQPQYNNIPPIYPTLAQNPKPCLCHVHSPHARACACFFRSSSQQRDRFSEIAKTMRTRLRGGNRRTTAQT